MAATTPTELYERLLAKTDLCLIDVRTPMEFSQVHVAQAQNIPLGNDLPGKLAADKESPVYLLCQTGGRAAKAAEQLSRAGFMNPLVVEGGTQAWIDAGLPVLRGTGKVISLERQVRIAAGTLVFTGVLLGYLVNPGFYLLSGFVGAGLVFAGITDFCGMGVLIARLPWNNRPA